MFLRWTGVAITKDFLARTSRRGQTWWKTGSAGLPAG